jgi:tRNA pseudouridine55 synthase
VIPLSEAASAAFPRLDLTADQARRLAQGARLSLSETGVPAPDPDTPIAAFAPEGTLVALVTVRDGQFRSLAVFAS